LEECRLLPIVPVLQEPYKQEAGGSIPSPPIAWLSEMSAFGRSSGKWRIDG
jgi:hypothetical protein